MCFIVMPYSSVRSAIQGVPALAQNQAVPRDHRPLRLPTFPNIERTSVLNFTATAQLSVPATGSCVVIQRRDPLYPLWFSTTATAAGACYASDALAGAAPASRPQLPFAANGSLDVSALVGSPYEYVFGVGLTNPYTTNQPIGVDPEGNVWFYCGSGLSPILRFNLSAGANATGWQANLQVLNCLSFDTTAVKEARFSSNVIGPATVEFYSPTAFYGWWRPMTLTCAVAGTTAPLSIDSITYATITGGTLAAPTIAAAPTVTGPYFTPLIASPPELSVAPAVYRDTMVNALGTLFTNATAVLSKEGTIEAVRVPTVYADLSLPALSTNFGALAREIAGCDRYYGLMEKGLYAFTYPDSLSAQFRCSAYQTVPVVRLGSTAYVQVINFVDYSSPASNFAITLDYHIEFRNTTMLWPVGVSTVLLEEWHQAQVALLSVTAFHENPTHLSAIASLVRAAAIKAWPVVKPFAKIALAHAQAAATNKLQQVASSVFTPRVSVPRQVALRETSTRKIGPRKVGKVPKKRKGGK